MCHLAQLEENNKELLSVNTTIPKEATNFL